MCNKNENPNMKEATNVNVQDLTKTSGSSPPGGCGLFRRIGLKIKVGLPFVDVVVESIRLYLAVHGPNPQLEIVLAVAMLIGAVARLL